MEGGSTGDNPAPTNKCSMNQPHKYKNDKATLS